MRVDSDLLKKRRLCKFYNERRDWKTLRLFTGGRAILTVSKIGSGAREMRRWVLLEEANTHFYVSSQVVEYKSVKTKKQTALFCEYPCFCPKNTLKLTLTRNIGFWPWVAPAIWVRPKIILIIFARKSLVDLQLTTLN